MGQVITDQISTLPSPVPDVGALQGPCGASPVGLCTLRDSSVVERLAHNQDVAGSIPAPATTSLESARCGAVRTPNLHAPRSDAAPASVRTAGIEDMAFYPCPFCGGSNTRVEESRHWTGQRYVALSATVVHWCNRPDGQPQSLLKLAGRDLEDAARTWNQRVCTTPIDTSVSTE